tara:strand:- start:273 stop:716 length:444 start_codon:yes stop_codon:yes gene_type:complete
LNKIGRLNISENEILKYSEVEKHFADKLNVIRISNNGIVDFSIINDLIKTAEAKPNIYGILTKKPNEQKWELKYIGQRKSKYIKDRLRQHLVKKHEKTGAQLERVNNELKNGNEIGIKLFAVEPDELRQFYEQKLLNNIDTLWNKHK